MGTNEQNLIHGIPDAGIGGNEISGSKSGMTIEFKQAANEDAGLLVDIYNASFFSDYQRFGACPGYGKTIKMMEESIRLYPKHIILCNNQPVGCVSCHPIGPQEYEIGCLCVIPAYQGKGIGTQAIRFVQDYYDDWKRLTLVTPLYKRENIRFYMEKCGFQIAGTEKDGNIELARFLMEKSPALKQTVKAGISISPADKEAGDSQN